MRLISKILVLLMLSVFVIMITVGLFIRRETKKIVTMEVDHQLQQNIGFIETLIKKEAEFTEKSIVIHTHHPAIGKALHQQKSGGVNRVLNDLVSIYPYYHYVLIVTLGGEIFATNTIDGKGGVIKGEQLLGQNFKDNPLFVTTQADRMVKGAPGRDPFLSILGIDKQLSQWFLCPVIQGGELVGWAVFAYDWKDNMERQLAQIEKHLQDVGFPVTEVLITDDQEKILVDLHNMEKTVFRPSPQKIWHKESIAANLNIIISGDRAKLLAGVARTEYLLIILVFSSSLFMVSALYFLLDRILLKRILGIHSGVQELERGHFSFRLADMGTDELGELSHSLNEMATSIEVNELAPGALIKVGSDSLITLINTRAEQLFGYTRLELIGRSIEKLIPAEYQEENHCSVITFFQKSLEKKPNVDGQFFALHKGGRCFPVEMTLSHRNSAEGLFVIAMIEDISERKEREQIIANKNEALEKSNKELEQFAFIASHDLREPLRKVRTFGEMLRSDIGENLSERGELFLGFMESATKRMDHLLSSLLAFSRVTSTNTAFEAVDLGQIVEDVKTDLELILEDCGGTVICQNLPVVEGDGSQLRQLFQNLIGNGLKYRKDDVSPIITIEAECNTSCQVSVRDNGIGFEPQYSEKIFEVFQRLHSHDDYQGTGIGLAICRRIVERHGGSISASGRPNEGAEFTFSVPRHQNKETS